MQGHFIRWHRLNCRIIGKFSFINRRLLGWLIPQVSGGRHFLNFKVVKILFFTRDGITFFAAEILNFTKL